MKTIKIMMAGIALVACCGCGGERSSSRGAAEQQPAATAEPQQGGTAPQTPAVELKRINSLSPTQHQFRMTVHLPAEGTSTQESRQ